MGVELLPLCERVLGHLCQAAYGPSRRYDVTSSCSLISHELITCRTAAGVGVDLAWVLEIGGQVSSDAVTTSYAAPSISGSSGTGSWFTTGSFEVGSSGCCVAVGVVVVIAMLTWVQ